MNYTQLPRRQSLASNTVCHLKKRKFLSGNVTMRYLEFLERLSVVSVYRQRCTWDWNSIFCSMLSHLFYAIVPTIEQGLKSEKKVNIRKIFSLWDAKACGLILTSLTPLDIWLSCFYHSWVNENGRFFNRGNVWLSSKTFEMCMIDHSSCSNQVDNRVCLRKDDSRK